MRNRLQIRTSQRQGDEVQGSATVPAKPAPWKSSAKTSAKRC